MSLNEGSMSKPADLVHGAVGPLVLQTIAPARGVQVSSGGFGNAANSERDDDCSGRRRDVRSGSGSPALNNLYRHSEARRHDPNSARLGYAHRKNEGRAEDP